MAEQWVQMKHPTLPDNPPSTVSRKAFEFVWKPGGWKLYTPKKEN